MIKKLCLGVGFGAGYVLGAKAGTERYEQIVSAFESCRASVRANLEKDLHQPTIDLTQGQPSRAGV